MCLAIFQPPGIALPADVFDNAWRKNDDGAGYMFCANGKLIVRKPFYKLKHLRRAYRADYAAYGASSPFVTHFRWSTHGSAAEINIHPHRLNDEVALVHNGVLCDFTPPRGSDLSDTAWYCQTVLCFRAPSDLVGETMRGIMAKHIGPANKFILLRANGDYSIVNEKAGTWDGGIWYSNDGYKAPIQSTWDWSDHTCAYNPLPVHYRPPAPTGHSGDKLFTWGEDGQYGYNDPYAGVQIDAIREDIDATEWALSQFPQGPMTDEEKAEYISLAADLQRLERQLDDCLAMDC